jgi:hypothetical protein
VHRTLLVDLDQARILERVVLPDVLDEPPVAGAPLVGDDHAVEGALLRAETLQPDPNRHLPAPACR